MQETRSLPVLSARIVKSSESLTDLGLDAFQHRHLGSSRSEVQEMLDTLAYGSLATLVSAAVPKSIRASGPLRLPRAKGERAALDELNSIMGENQVFKSYLGQGYYGTVTPGVIQRNILENPGWYTAYTPYQAEIAQGRMEALINFQTMIVDLTRMDVANASLLDEGTAAAEAMSLMFGMRSNPAANKLFVAQGCFVQTIDVVRTRALPLGIEVIVGDLADFSPDSSYFGAIAQYPAEDGSLKSPDKLIQAMHKVGGLVAIGTDLLALTIFKTPGEWGADIAFGSAQRFGVPMGYGGPHAAFFAVKDALKRHMPGRLIGVSHDRHGDMGYRLSLQTREQHIRRDKATSNICTAQVLLAVLASMYAVYHGPGGLRAIGERVTAMASALAGSLKAIGYRTSMELFFDTVLVSTNRFTAHELVARAANLGINIRRHSDDAVTVSMDETTTVSDLKELMKVFTDDESQQVLKTDLKLIIPEVWSRGSSFLSHPVFNHHHTETEMLRYIKRLESKDLSLCQSMIPLGSCTMKLNATSQMIPVTWETVGNLHPFAPVSQTQGYQKVFKQLCDWLAEITGMAGVSLQPNAGSQGEYAGLMAIRGYHRSRRENERNVCLIPVSAHGTNPASAVMAGMKVVPVNCDAHGNIDLADLEAKAQMHKASLSCAMITYPSTHGVFEETIARAAEIVHANGGQLYLDGANLNALVGLCRPGDFGADVCHMNLHKTFCIPHGGGGPGMGPIGVQAHLIPFLPGHSVVCPAENGTALGAVSSAPWGSASILVISWMYIVMLGGEGLTEATRRAILHANYMAKRLEGHYSVLFRGNNGLVAHEFILDLRPWKQSAGIEVEDVAKRLIDYGFHAPTVSWPVPGTMMIEPTESESKEEMDRFCDAMLAIHKEMQRVAIGNLPKDENPLKNAPHTAAALLTGEWTMAYTREEAAYPMPDLKSRKWWPCVGRIDNVYGDRNLVCSCPPMEQ